MVTGKSAKQIIIDEFDFEGETLFSMDIEGDGNGAFVFGQKLLDNIIIIDEVSHISEKCYRLLVASERHLKNPRPKQPDWARHNQAPRSARKRR